MSASSPETSSPRRPAGHAAVPTATLDDVDILSQLPARTRPMRNQRAEDRAVATLATEMALNPRNMLQKLADIAVELCRADTAGISLLEGDVFRWEAVSGVFASYRNGTMPRDASPCGVCIDRNATQLMHRPDRAFPALRTDPPFVETLLLPFHHEGRPIGAVWVVAHSEARKFDSEDERIVSMLTHFASAAWQLWKAREQAEAATRRKDGVLAMVGHEFRGPLEAIHTAAQVLRETMETDMQNSAIDIIARQTDHLARLVSDLVDAGSIDRGTLLVQMENVALRSVIARAVEVAQPALLGRQQRLIVDVPPEAINVEADPTRLVQLVSNLLDNAVKYSPKYSTIRVAAERLDGHVAVHVRDSGIGIPADKLGDVFEPFVRLDAGRQAARGGLGLGLALVRRLAELHGGTIHVQSAGEGHGSQFTVRLPVM